MTLYTTLTPLNSEIYNSSFTILSYNPADEKSITSMEIVKFNSPATLSQQYAILGKVSKKMGKVYKKSGDESLAQLVRAYHIMEKKTKFLSKLVKKQLSTFDMLILKSLAILTDDLEYDICMLLCGLVISLGCGLPGVYICGLVCSASCAPAILFPPTYAMCFSVCSIICGAMVITICYLIGFYGASPGCSWLCSQI